MSVLIEDYVRFVLSVMGVRRLSAAARQVPSLHRDDRMGGWDGRGRGPLAALGMTERRVLAAPGHRE